MQKPSQKKRIALLLLVGAVAWGLLFAGIYLGTYYKADSAARAALITSRSINSAGSGDSKTYRVTSEMNVEKTEDGYVFHNGAPKAGFIFYPGGKVEHTAYAPLMRALAEEGVLCVLTDMPLRLAVLDMNAADGIAEKYPEVTRWSIGGHSLGGAMAASWAAKHPQTVDALVLLAAYSTAKLPDSLSVVSLYGSNDTVLDRAKYDECRANLPADAQHILLEGGNHAQFGSYGPQSGDGEATMTAQAQLAATVQAVLPVLLGQ